MQWERKPKPFLRYKKEGFLTMVEIMILLGWLLLLVAVYTGCGIERVESETSSVTNGYISKLDPLLEDCLGYPFTVSIPTTLIVDYKPGGGGAAYQAPDTILIWEGVQTFFAYFGHEYVRHVLFHQSNDLWKTRVAMKQSSSDWSPPTINCMWNAAETLSREYDI